MNKNNLTKGLFTALLLISSVVSADEKYPAADFQPKVVYSDDNYKHNKTLPTSASKNASVSSATSTKEQASDESVATTETKKEDSSVTYLLGLLGLAAAGFFLFSR